MALNKIVVTYRAVYIQGQLHKEGDVVMVPDRVAKEMIGLGRGKIFVDKSPPKEKEMKADEGKKESKPPKQKVKEDF